MIWILLELAGFCQSFLPMKMIGFRGELELAGVW
jgi:hypothetical protein